MKAELIQTLQSLRMPDWVIQRFKMDPETIVELGPLSFSVDQGAILVFEPDLGLDDAISQDNVKPICSMVNDLIESGEEYRLLPDEVEPVVALRIEKGLENALA